MKNLEVFQGKDKLNSGKNYFEGWYFKHSKENLAISFIPGINIKNGKKYAFIQVVTKYNSYYINYDFDTFQYSDTPFYIQIGNSLFSNNKIVLDINHEIKITGTLYYDNHQKIKQTSFAPNIMGPFAHLKFMECNHAIISMKHHIMGNLTINGLTFSFNNGQGYIEKDWGTSFPKSYIWCQANNFQNDSCSIFFSLADIPFKMLHFKGFICSLLLDGKEYRFATYNGSKIKGLKITETEVALLIQKGSCSLSINCSKTNGQTLSAPIKGGMGKNIIETIDSTMDIILKEGSETIFSGTSKNAGLEIV